MQQGQAPHMGRVQAFGHYYRCDWDGKGALRRRQVRRAEKRAWLREAEAERSGADDEG